MDSLCPCDLEPQHLEEAAGTKWTVHKRNNCALLVLEGTCCPSRTFLIAYALYTANLYLLFLALFFFYLSPENETGTDISGNELDWCSWEDVIHSYNEQ